MRQLVPALALLIGLSAPLRAADGAATAQPDLTPARALAAEKLMALAVIPDARAFLAHLELSARAVAPEGIPQGLLSTQAAALLGEQDLSGLAPGPVLVAVPSGLPRPQIGVVVPMTTAAACAERLRKSGWQAEAQGSLLLLAHSAQGLTAAKSLAPAWAALAASDKGSDAIIHADLAAIGSTFGPMMQMALGFAAMAPQQDPMVTVFVQRMLPIAQVLGGELGSELRGLRLALDFSGEQLRMASVLSYQPDGLLARGLVAPAGRDPAPPALRLGDHAEDFLRMTGRFDPVALQTLVDGCTERLAADPRSSAILDDKTKQLSKRSLAAISGSFAMGMRQANGSDLACRSAFGLRDPGAYLDDIEAQMRLLADPTSTLGGMMQQLGVTTRLRRSVREVAGTSVHALDMQLSPEAQARPELAKAMRGQELAVVDGVGITVQGESIDPLLQRQPTQPLTPGAEAAIGPKRHIYMDLDLVGYLAASLAVSGNEHLPFDRATLERGRGFPMHIAQTWGPACQAWELRLPLRPIAALVQSMQGAQRGRPARSAPANPPPRRGNQDPNMF